MIEQLYKGSKTAVYRGAVKPDDTTFKATEKTSSVIIKVMQQEHPSFIDLLQFRSQYTITQNLYIPSGVRPLELEP